MLCLFCLSSSAKLIRDTQEETLEIEYIESILPPQKMADLPHKEWVSSVSCKLEGWVSGFSAKSQVAND